jgi:hypothetical protein
VAGRDEHLSDHMGMHLIRGIGCINDAWLNKIRSGRYNQSINQINHIVFKAVLSCFKMRFGNGGKYVYKCYQTMYLL